MVRSAVILNRLLLVGLFASCAEAQAEDDPIVDIAVDYTADIIDVAGRDIDDKTYFLDNLNVTADVDLDGLLGWKGGSAHVHLLNNLGGGAQ